MTLISWGVASVHACVSIIPSLITCDKVYSIKMMLAIGAIVALFRAH